MRWSPALSWLTLLAVTTAARAADFAGTYRGDIKGRPSSVELAPADGGYAGAIRLGDVALPCRATADGDHLSGTFASGASTFPFTATLAGDTLALSTAGTTYTLTRPARNPLEAAAGAPAATAAPDAAGGVTELARTATGRTLLLPQPSAKTADAALDAAFPQLARAVGAAVQVTGRFADTKQPDRGGASFTAAVDGRPIHGIAFCGASTAGGVDVSAAYTAVDAPPAEWQTLTAALPHQVKLQEYDLPDGTGSIGLPDGWTCNSQSAADPLAAIGPDGQNVVMGGVLAINGSKSPSAHMRAMVQQSYQRSLASAQRMRWQAPPPPPTDNFTLYGEFDDPLPMLQHVYPQISQHNQAGGRPPRQIDQVLACTLMPSGPGGARVQLISLLFTEGTGASAIQYRQMGRFQSGQAGNFDVALLISWTMRAKADRFDRDVPTLMAVARSFKINDQRLAEVGQARCQQIADNSQRAMAAQQQRFDQQQQLSFQVHQQQMDASAQRFDQFESNINAQNLASHRAAQDFTEMVGGYQKVVDANTGEVMHVDYYDSQAIVQGLNDAAGDPHEFVAVHRRDEVYPLTR